MITPKNYFIIIFTTKYYIIYLPIQTIDSVKKSVKSCKCSCINLLQQSFANKKSSAAILTTEQCFIRPIGIEPTHPAPEAGALSTELRAQITINMIPETEPFVKDFLCPRQACCMYTCSTFIEIFIIFTNKGLHFRKSCIIIILESSCKLFLLIKV